MTLGQRIAKAREEKELTQIDLAGKVGVTAAMISMIESGYKVPGVFTLREIAKVLEVSVDSLLA